MNLPALGRLQKAIRQMPSKIHIHTRRNSKSAKELAAHLSCTYGPRSPEGVSHVINWGEHGELVHLQGAQVLNPKVDTNKQRQLIHLAEGGVKVPEVYLSSPPRGSFPRLNSHSEGKDILKCLRNPEGADYWTQYIPVKNEVRVHIFKSKSIRMGIKLPIHPHASHPYIKSHRFGWNISYSMEDLFTLPDGERRNVREEARKAIGVLGLDFGAVDVGLDEQGRAWVFEVNTAPGIEGNTLLRYASHIKEFVG